MYTLLIVIYLAFISLGLPDSLLGTAWPVMHLELGVPLSTMGIISVLVSGGTIISSYYSGRLIQKLGTHWVTTISIFMTALAMMGFSFSNNILMIILFAIPYGLGAGAIDAALNNYVALHYSSKHMSWLHCFWGVGTIISPFVMSYSLTHTSWSNGYRIISFVQIIIGIVLLFTVPLWNKNEKTNNSSAVSNRRIGLREALKIPGVPQLLIAFSAYCAGEGTAMAWSCTYLVESKDLDEPRAAALASLFFIGLTLGRFLSGFIVDKLGDTKSIKLGSTIITIGIITMLIPSDGYSLSLFGLFTTGLGCAPIYPCIIHSTPKSFGAENSGAIIGIQMSSAYLGATLIPPLFGVVGNSLGFSIFPIYLIAFFLIMIFMHSSLLKKTTSI